MKTIENTPEREKNLSKKHPHPKDDFSLKPQVHRKMLKFINEAVRPNDLVYGKPVTAHVHPKDPHPEHHEHKEEETHKFLDYKTAAKILAFRDEKYPLGFRNLRELLEIKRFDFSALGKLKFFFSNSTLGQWDDFPVDIPRRGNGARDGVVHAILLKTGKVLFITGDETTLLWDPENTAPATYQNPVNQPHTMPGGYSQICGHHVQLSDSKGSILSIGGGGYGPNTLAKAAYIFDPITNTWRRSANDMAQDKWYPTAVSLGGKKILIVSGNTSANNGEIEIFDETTETFHTVSNSNIEFPNLYPGLHILPNNAIFYSRTGFGGAGAGPGGFAQGDDTINPHQLGGRRPAYLTLSNNNTLANWQKIVTSPINRTKGMSVTLLSNTAPHVRVLVMGGSDNATNDTYEIFDASVLSPTAKFSNFEAVPDGENRSLCSGVLLPDGNLFVCGGISRVNSPCTMFNPSSDTWSPMAALGSIRQYHSVAILLPSGKVMMAGWNNKKIEIFSPPYLFNGPRPTISNAPSIVHHGADFTIESPDASDLVKVVFVKPMAVTHQTDSEQRVIELTPFIHDHVNPNRIKLKAPDGGHPHPIAPRGNYMMFAINNLGVPSEATWIYLH